MVSAVHQRLRAATHDVHRSLEDRLAMVERVSSHAGRAAMVVRFYRLHAEVELAIAPWLDDLPGLDFPERRRTLHLAADLATLGVATPKAEPRAVRADGLGEALGLMYVLEGSTLGGQVIRRQVADRAGLGFLDPYRGRTGERWRAFLAVLERELTEPAQAETAVRGALAGFRHAERRLCEDADV